MHVLALNRNKNLLFFDTIEVIISFKVSLSPSFLSLVGFSTYIWLAVWHRGRVNGIKFEMQTMFCFISMYNI